MQAVTLEKKTNKTTHENNNKSNSSFPSLSFEFETLHDKIQANLVLYFPISHKDGFSWQQMRPMEHLLQQFRLLTLMSSSLITGYNILPNSNNKPFDKVFIFFFQFLTYVILIHLFCDLPC